MSSRMPNLVAATLAVGVTTGCGWHGPGLHWPWQKSTANPAPKQTSRTATQVYSSSNSTDLTLVGTYRIEGQKLVKAADQTLAQTTPLGNWRVELYQLVPGQTVDWANPFAVTLTDPAGDFSFDGLPAGTYLVTSDVQSSGQAYEEGSLSGPPEAQPLDISHVAPYVNTPPPQGLEQQGFEVTVGSQPCECGLAFTEAIPLPHGVGGGGPCPVPSPVDPASVDPSPDPSPTPVE